MWVQVAGQRVGRDGEVRISGITTILRGERRFRLPPPPLPIGEAQFLTALWLLTIFTLSSYPFLQPPGEVSGRDKLAHLVVYGILGHLVGNVAWEDIRNRRARRFVAAVAFGFLWGVFDEIYQGLVPGRFVSGLDLTADTIGAFLGVLTSWNAAVRGTREGSTA